MMFLKITRKAKGFLTRFGWLLAELLFVFIGMCGAFLLERMHEENLDALKERQILQALIDEFHDYEKELSDFKHWLDEGYAKSFFNPIVWERNLFLDHSIWRHGKCKHRYLGGNASEWRNRAFRDGNDS